MMRRVRNWITAAAFGATVLLLAAGCAKDQKEGLRGVNRKDADALNAQHSRFEASEDPPFTAQTRFAAGQLAESQNSPGMAITQYKEAVKLDEKHSPSWYRLGVLYAQMKEFPRAIDAWKQYLKATDGAATGYSNLGFCYELAGNFDQAEAAYKKGIEKDPHNQACRVNYGLMLARHGYEDQAKAQLDTVLSPAEVQYNLGSVYEQQGKKNEARAAYEKALEFDPNMVDAKARLLKMK